MSTAKPLSEDQIPQFQDVADRSMEMTKKVVNAFAAAYIEQLRLTADLVSSLTGEVLQSIQPEGKPEGKGSLADSVRKGRQDTFNALLRAADKAIGIPSRGIDKFYEIYKKA